MHLQRTLRTIARLITQYADDCERCLWGRVIVQVGNLLHRSYRATGRIKLACIAAEIHLLNDVSHGPRHQAYDRAARDIDTKKPNCQCKTASDASQYKSIFFGAFE